MELIVGKQKQPYSACLYGVAGIGKSTLATSAYKPLFLNVEDALHHIDCVKTPIIPTVDNLKYWLRQISSGDYKGQFNTVVLDTVDALEDILAREICKNHNRESLGSFGFGQGYDLLNKAWLDILNCFDYARRKFNLNVILIGHEQIRRFEDPLGDGYDRISLKMHHKSALTLISRMDAVLYMNWDKIIKKTDSNVRKAIGTGKRIIHTVETPAFSAKNRFGLPPKMEADENFFKTFEKLIYEEFEPQLVNEV